MIDLDTLVERDHWERLHVTISLETAEACAYTARLYTGHGMLCPSEPDTPQGLELVGCALSTSTHNVRGAYAECQLEVPMGIKDIGVVVRGQDNCQLSSNDSLVVWLRRPSANARVAALPVSLPRCHEISALRAVDTRCVV